MLRTNLVLFAILGLAPGFAAAQAELRVEKPDIQGPRPLDKQTAAAAIRDYLLSWQSMGSALDQNRSDLLNAAFVGDAKDKLAETIKQQASLGIRTHYTDRSHHLQIVFYSPEGSSIELKDDVEYDLELIDHDKPEAAQRMHARYLAVLTPSESKWMVRVIQAERQ